MDGEAWWAAVHGVATSRARLSDFTLTFHFPVLGKDMAIHSSVLAWRIPGTEEPGGLPSMGLHRVGHDWSDLAAVATRNVLGKTYKKRGSGRHIWLSQRLHHESKGRTLNTAPWSSHKTCPNPVTQIQRKKKLSSHRNFLFSRKALEQ